MRAQRVGESGGGGWLRYEGRVRKSDMLEGPPTWDKKESFAT